MQVVVGDGSRGDRIRRVEREAILGASVFLMKRTVVIESYAQVQSEIALHAPIVLHKTGREVGIP